MLIKVLIGSSYHFILMGILDMFKKSKVATNLDMPPAPDFSPSPELDFNFNSAPNANFPSIPIQNNDLKLEIPNFPEPKTEPMQKWNIDTTSKAPTFMQPEMPMAPSGSEGDSFKIEVKPSIIEPPKLSEIDNISKIDTLRGLSGLTGPKIEDKDIHAVEKRIDEHILESSEKGTIKPFKDFKIEPLKTESIESKEESYTFAPKQANITTLLQTTTKSKNYRTQEISYISLSQCEQLSGDVAYIKYTLKKVEDAMLSMSDSKFQSEKVFENWKKDIEALHYNLMRVDKTIFR